MSFWLKVIRNGRTEAIQGVVLVDPDTGLPAVEGADRELVVTTYRVKTAFTGASVGDTVTLAQVIDLAGAPTTVSTLWRNQTTAADLAGAPSAANLEIAGAPTLTDAQLRASAVPVSGPVTDAQMRATAVPVTTGGVSVVTANIANAASLSVAYDLGALKLGRITTPAAWTAADLTFQSSTDNVTWNNLYDKDGAEYKVVAAASRDILVPLSDFLAIRYLKIRSGTAATPVAQGASRDLILTLVP